MSTRALRISEQLDLLTERGLKVSEPEKSRLAKLLISQSYFRLSRYWRYFQEAPHLGDTTFRETATVDGLISIYEFDRNLRRILLSGLADLEVAFRSRLAYLLATLVGPYAHVRPHSYIDDIIHRDGIAISLRDELISAIASDVARSTDDSVICYRGSPDQAPIWVAIEAMSMGVVSKAYRLVSNRDVRYQIARSFGLPDPQFTESVIRSFALLRNVCAHHGRIWNTKPALGTRVLNSLKVERDKGIYHQTPWGWIVMLAHLVDGIRGDHSYSTELWDHIEAHPSAHEGLQYPHRR